MKNRNPAVESSGGAASTAQWKARWSPAGLHLFDRSTGLNVLLDEVAVPAERYSRAPRQVSIALTNRCDLACSHCYAPKSRHALGYDMVTRWLAELDANGTLGVGFGGGEPTLYPRFVELCRHATRETRLAVTFTTHGHHVDQAMADELLGSVHFIRVSMDGVGSTYEAIRRRPFVELVKRLKTVATISSFGINFVVNERTLPDLGEAASLTAELGGCELLLLPQVATRRCARADDATLRDLLHWVEGYRGSLRLCINEGSSDGFPTCDPLSTERGLCAYAHIDAAGVLKSTSFEDTGVRVGEGSVLSVLEELRRCMIEDDHESVVSARHRALRKPRDDRSLYGRN